MTYNFKVKANSSDFITKNSVQNNSAVKWTTFVHYLLNKVLCNQMTVEPKNLICFALFFLLKGGPAELSFWLWELP